ncbi:hypothetical protein [Kitasatospora viridis]|uniref:Uncharacterized protein n=1 Tax=Kitasatospora viridis TaxID=281105 RepID=A0A561SA08_9ACTN|nr:hypothetical protein [Kitasatospora viridis]TWF71713.1 hypothetical protein FHX73_1884 [Kitasatospora viridis]
MSPHPIETAARPDPAAALLRTVDVVHENGWRTLVQHWAADVRTTTGGAPAWERREWITRISARVGETRAARVMAHPYGPGQLPQARAHWAQVMGAVQGEWRAGRVRVQGDVGALPEPPYAVSVDRGEVRRSAAPRPVAQRGPMTLEAVAAITFS